jgi:Transcriptional regulatory protein, C terminal
MSMGATAKALVPPLVRGLIERAPLTALSLSDLLARTQTLNVNEIRQLARFVPVIILIPESSPGQSAQPNIPCNRSLKETGKTAKTLDLLGRATDQGRSLGQDGEFSFGQVNVNFLEMSAQRNGEPVVLTTMEFKVLKYLIQNARRVVSRNELLNEVWGYDNYPLTRTVDNHILRLRQKLEQRPSRPAHIRTVHGAGYKFLP